MSSSAQRALRILETVGAADRPLGVTEIARALDLAAGTVFRSLDALERAGYVARYQASARYVLGGMVGRLRQSFFAQFPLRDICMPYLRQLAFASGETASLIVPVGWHAVRIAAAPGTNDVTSSPHLGDVRLLADGAGQAVLAFRGADSARRLAAWAEQAGHGRLDPARLERDLETVRARGLAVEETAFAARRAAVALPVRHGDGAVAAIAIEGPALDLDRPDEEGDLARWTGIVRAIEGVLRARPDLARNPFDHVDPDTIRL